MLRNKLYQYGDETGRIPAHTHYGKEIFDNMVKNKHVVALINSETGESMTYGEFAQKTVDIALSLARIGVRKGDIVCMCSEKRFEVLPTVLGIICAGATFSPIDLTYGAEPLLRRLKIARPKVLFCSPSTYEAHRTTFEAGNTIEKYIIFGDQETEGTILMKDFLTETAPLDQFVPVPVNGFEDRTYVIFSSGTTGVSKGVPITHLASLLNAQCLVPDSYRDIPVLNTREWYYPYGLIYTMAFIRVCATVVYVTSAKEHMILEAIQNYKTQVIQVAPSTINEFIKSGILDNYDVSSIKWMISSSTPIGCDGIIAVKERIPHMNVIQLYGMSEAGSICSELEAPLGTKPGSSGTPCRGFIIKVVDIDTREPLGPYQRGEICYKGPSVMKGYLDNAVPDCFDKEGFLLTGDVGYYDDDGYFYIVNRIKELIKYYESSIPPAELEAILLKHPAVREAGIVGKPDPECNERPVAFIALQPNMTASEQELTQYVESRISHKMRLAGGVKFVDRLPRGAGDKLDRKQLKIMVEED